MRFLACLLVLVPLALHAQPALTAWPEPEGSPAELLCVEHDGDRVCRHLNDAEPRFTFTVERDTQEIGRWDAGGWSLTGFRVFDADLDGDGHPERIIANNDAVSNGLGVTYWTLYVLQDEEGRAVPASIIPVQEFGAEGGSFAESNSGLVLWATEWLQGPDPSGQRDEGLYFVGRPFRFSNGCLVPAPDLPLRARRFLESFAQERARTGDVTAPVHWLSDPRAETRPTDPYLLGGETASVHGVVEEVTPMPAESGTTNWVLRIRPEDGEPVVYTYAFGYSEGIERPLRYLGDGASGRLYPAEYHLVSPVAWLRGRAVRVATYADDTDPRLVLWLD